MASSFKLQNVSKLNARCCMAWETSNYFELTLAACYCELPVSRGILPGNVNTEVENGETKGSGGISVF